MPVERLKVVQTCEYPKYGEIIELKPIKNKLMGWLIEGDEIVVSQEEAKRLIKDKICIRGWFLPMDISITEKQNEFISSEAFETLFGGAAGGG